VIGNTNCQRIITFWGWFFNSQLAIGVRLVASVIGLLSCRFGVSKLALNSCYSSISTFSS